MPLTDKQWTGLARDFHRALTRVVPGWTDAAPHDPGVTVLELLAYVLTELQSRSNALDPQARLHAQRVAERATALATALTTALATSPDNSDCAGTLQRVNYFSGMLLGVDDFRAEQNYFRTRLNRHNRLLHGSGIADGLAVTVEDSTNGANGPNGPQVTIAPGFALDRHGNEICVDKPATLTLPTQGAALFVQVSYAEQPCGLTPVANGNPLDANTGEPTAQATRIAETFSATLAVEPAADAVVIARLRQVRGRWRVDRGFKAVRLREPRSA